MSPKKRIEPTGYFDYAIYPLEGSDLCFKLMIRQPGFVESNVAMQILEQTKKNKPHELLNQIKFEEIQEGDCIQMLHEGSYDNEAASFKIMEDYAESRNYKRKTKTHREIYLSDARKVSPEKLKTVLRFNVEKK